MKKRLCIASILLILILPAQCISINTNSNGAITAASYKVPDSAGFKSKTLLADQATYHQDQGSGSTYQGYWVQNKDGSYARADFTVRDAASYDYAFELAPGEGYVGPSKQVEAKLAANVTQAASTMLSAEACNAEGDHATASMSANQASVSNYRNSAIATKTSASASQSIDAISSDSGVSFALDAHNKERDASTLEIRVPYGAAPKPYSIQGYHDTATAIKTRSTIDVNIALISSAQFGLSSANKEKDYAFAWTEMQEVKGYTAHVLTIPKSASIQDIAASASRIETLSGRAYNKVDDEVDWYERVDGNIINYFKSMSAYKGGVSFADGIYDADQAYIDLAASHWDGYSLHWGNTFETSHSTITAKGLEPITSMKPTCSAYLGSAGASASQTLVRQLIKGSEITIDANAESFKYDGIESDSASGDGQFTVNAYTKGRNVKALIN